MHDVRLRVLLSARVTQWESSTVTDVYLAICQACKMRSSGLSREALVPFAL